MLGEGLQPRGEHVGSDPAQLLLQLVEALGALEERGDGEQRPAVADLGEGVGEGGGWCGGLRHGSIVAAPAYVNGGWVGWGPGRRGGTNVTSMAVCAIETTLVATNVISTTA